MNILKEEIMSFINDCYTLIRKSNKDMFYIYYDNGINFDYYNSNNIKKFKNTKNRFINFSNAYFSLDKNDNVYGIYNNMGLNMIEINNYSTKISEKKILNYDFDKFNILFPYIHKIENDIHIIYHIFSNSSSNTSALFHHYKKDDTWIENKIDFVNHIIADNFVVIFNYDILTIFYFNLVDGFEQLFFSRFNPNTLTWSTPACLTNSKKSKLYLSVIKDNLNFYHITFCENDSSGYAVKYINGYLSEDKLNVNTSTYITGPSTCMYPSIIKEGNRIYIMWVNYNRLHSCYSDDLGKTWSEHNIDEHSIENDFVRAKFFSNYSDDKLYNVDCVFSESREIEILGF
jgi:hypothetical protein